MMYVQTRIILNIIGRIYTTLRLAFPANLLTKRALILDIVVIRLLKNTHIRTIINKTFMVCDACLALMETPRNLRN